MAYTIRHPLARRIGLMVLASLLSGACLSSALAEEPTLPAGGTPVVQPSLPPGEPLTDFETLELHYRRYTTAANTIAQSFKQLNQKIQEVSLAAKAVEAKNNSHNLRVLSDKLRQLENTRTNISHQHAQLQSQMQNEYRSYTAISNDLKAKYDAPRDARASDANQETTKEPQSRPAKAKERRTSEPAK